MHVEIVSYLLTARDTNFHAILNLMYAARNAEVRIIDIDDKTVCPEGKALVAFHHQPNYAVTDSELAEMVAKLAKRAI